jgi:hypothetical protein
VKGAVRSCRLCNTFRGCGRHQMYKCKGCERVLPWSFGASDDMPDHCDDCWAKEHDADSQNEHRAA